MTASKMATQGNTVVVTFNYRLNLMGFLAVPSLDAEGHHFGNYGLLDQQMVLQWVRDNIANFGGDPNNVTLGGQSAGAEDTGFAMLSPGAAGLVQRGICESFCPTGNLPTLPAAKSIGEQFATAAGCGGKTGAAQARCLRAVPASMVEQLAGTASAASAYVIGPMLDGAVLPVQPPVAWANGQFSHIPLMNGNVQDEENFGLAITEYFSNPRQPPTNAQYMSTIAHNYASPPYPAGTAEKILKLYPIANYPSVQVAWDRVGTDPGICAEMALNTVLAPQIPVYAYLFNDQTPPFYFRRCRLHAAGLPHGRYPIPVSALSRWPGNAAQADWRAGDIVQRTRRGLDEVCLDGKSERRRQCTVASVQEQSGRFGCAARERSVLVG